MLDMYTIKRYINGEMDEIEFKEIVDKFIADLNRLIDKYGANSKKEHDENGMLAGEIEASHYIGSAKTDLGTLSVIEASEKLPREAAICDMCNNLAHATKLIKADTRTISTALFSLKTEMIEQIAKECERQGNECYGKGYDDSKERETFIVDVPSYGQISWHLGNRTIKCKSYDFEKEQTDYKNCDFLAWAVPEEKMGNHTIKVVKARNNEELMQSLYGGVPPAKTKNSEEPISLD